jgi:asparagine N-glycosylation enzyme membrane subunit Stt3
MLGKQSSPIRRNFSSREVVVQFSLATAVAIMGLLTVVAVYFLWARKATEKKEG